MKKIYISDITLKELASNRENKLLFREKTAIAEAVSAIGANAVELPGIKNLQEDTIIYKTISANIKDSTVAIPVGFTADDVKNAWECVKGAKKARLQVVLPTATATMEYTYHLKEEKMLAKIEELISASRELSRDVEFVALDATRADISFLKSACSAAEKSGAGIITLCDSEGTALPEEIGKLTKEIRATVKAKLYVEVSDNINMATSCAFAAIAAGADGLKCALCGSGKLLSGNISDAIKMRGEALDVTASLDSTKVHTSINEIINKIGKKMEESAPASETSKILLDGDSTIREVSEAAAILGYDLSSEDIGKVHKALLQFCEKKGTLGARELEGLIASFAMQAPSTYHLESYTTNCTNLGSSMSQVTLRRGEEIISGVSCGDGPIDSVFLAIEQSIGFHYELDDFQIQAVTSGKEALGSAVVRLRNHGKLYSGNGISNDILAASIRAYLNALNKIVFEEN